MFTSVLYAIAKILTTKIARVLIKYIIVHHIINIIQL